MTYRLFHFGGSIMIFCMLLCCAGQSLAQSPTDTLPLRDSLLKPDSMIASDSASLKTDDSDLAVVKKTIYGTASFYNNKFQGRKTASGDIFSQKKLTAACNVLPLGTLIRVTNLKNGKSVVVRTNDRLHPKMKRLVDLTRSAAVKLDYIGRGLTRVKVEVLRYPEKRKKK